MQLNKPPLKDMKGTTIKNVTANDAPEIVMRLATICSCLDLGPLPTRNSIISRVKVNVKAKKIEGQANAIKEKFQKSNEISALARCEWVLKVGALAYYLANFLSKIA